MSCDMREPKRLVLGADTPLARILQASKAEAPTDEALRRIETALLTSIGGGGAGDAGASGDTASGDAGPDGAGIAGAGGTGAGGLLAASAIAKLVGTLVVSALVGASGVTLLGPLLPRAPRPTASAPAEMPGIASGSPHDVPAPVPTALFSVTRESDLADGATPRVLAPVWSGPRGVESVRVPIAPFPEALMPAEETEAALLARAQDALGASPSHALRLCNEHGTRFPRGILGQEREVIAIEALVRMGRVPEARVRAAAFRKLFPRSAHMSRIDRLVPPP